MQVNNVITYSEQELIVNSEQEVRAGVELVNKAGQSLEEIDVSVKQVAEFVSEIAAASQEQSAGIDQVSQAVNSMDEMTQQNGVLVEETTAALQSAQTQVAALRQSVAFFKTGDMTMRQVTDANIGTGETDHPVRDQQRMVRQAFAGGQAAAVAHDAASDGWQEF